MAVVGSSHTITVGVTVTISVGRREAVWMQDERGHQKRECEDSTFNHNKKLDLRINLVGFISNHKETKLRFIFLLLFTQLIWYLSYEILCNQEERKIRTFLYGDLNHKLKLETRFSKISFTYLWKKSQPFKIKSPNEWLKWKNIVWYQQ